MRGWLRNLVLIRPGHRFFGAHSGSERCLSTRRWEAVARSAGQSGTGWYRATEKASISGTSTANMASITLNSANCRPGVWS